MCRTPSSSNAFNRARLIASSSPNSLHANGYRKALIDPHQHDGRHNTSHTHVMGFLIFLNRRITSSNGNRTVGDAGPLSVSVVLVCPLSFNARAASSSAAFLASFACFSASSCCNFNCSICPRFINFFFGTALVINRRKHRISTGIHCKAKGSRTCLHRYHLNHHYHYRSLVSLTLTVAVPLLFSRVLCGAGPLITPNVIKISSAQATFIP